MYSKNEFFVRFSAYTSLVTGINSRYQSEQTRGSRFNHLSRSTHVPVKWISSCNESNRLHVQAHTMCAARRISRTMASIDGENVEANVRLMHRDRHGVSDNREIADFVLFYEGFFSPVFSCLNSRVGYLPVVCIIKAQFHNLWLILSLTEVINARIRKI